MLINLKHDHLFCELSYAKKSHLLFVDDLIKLARAKFSEDLTD